MLHGVVQKLQRRFIIKLHLVLTSAQDTTKETTAESSTPNTTATTESLGVLSAISIIDAGIGSPVSPAFPHVKIAEPTNPPAMSDRMNLGRSKTYIK